MRTGSLLLELHHKLLEAFGPQGWWPGESPFEVAVGAILTQNTNWNNVARVIGDLKDRGLMAPRSLRELPDSELARLLRPAGYYNLKARRLKNFLEFLEQYQDSMVLLGREDQETLRPALLRVKGIGPETADSILLYALDNPTFVVDAYTFRVLKRHGLLDEPVPYEELRRWFMDHLPPEVPLYQEYHALLVRAGKEFCRPQPRCPRCPLHGWPADD